MSKKIYEPVLGEMVAEGLFKTGKLGNADAWQWVASPGTDADPNDDSEPEMF